MTQKSRSVESISSRSIRDEGTYIFLRIDEVGLFDCLPEMKISLSREETE